MSEITTKELRIIHEALPALYASQDVKALTKCALMMLSDLFDADFVGFAIADPHLPSVLGAWHPQIEISGALQESFRALAHQHPLFTGWRRVGSVERALRISECVSPAIWEKTPLRNEYFRPLRMRSQVGVWKEFGGGHHIELSANRCGADFTQHDSDKLAAIAQHVGQAYLNCKLIAELRRQPTLAKQAMLHPELHYLPMSSTSLGYEPDELEPLVSSMPSGLTDREREVLDWVVEGKTNPEIAIILNISSRTVQKHLERVFQKLSVETRTAAAMRAVELGLSSGEMHA
jgi:DNA-binding CsgD family transcriptional regulator